MRSESVWKSWHTIGVLALCVGVALVGLFARRMGRMELWLAVGLALAAIAIVAGHGVKGRWLGALINSRNRMSLAQLQIILWLLLLLSGLLTAVLVNIGLGAENPLALALPSTAWLLMGFSMTTLVGASVSLSNKKGPVSGRVDDPANGGMLTEAYKLRSLAEQGVPAGDVETSGKLVGYTNPRKASVADFFRGEEIDTAGTVDVARLQMVVSTLILVVAYAAALAAMLNGTEAITAFPELDPGLLALMGISDTGYLANKAISHTKEGQG